GGEACDVIVDGVSYPTEPAFRDGVISQAVEKAVEAGTLYFASAGDYGNGYMFTSNWECESDLFPGSSEAPCEGNGIASHVFDTEATGLDRYMFPLGGATFNSSGTFYVHWDDDEGTSRIVTLQLIVLGETSSGEFFPLDSVVAVSDPGTAVVSLDLPEDFADDGSYYLTISQSYSDFDGVEMR
ncbi:unnamed protein product, partial [Ascophyllum nodosum]